MKRRIIQEGDVVHIYQLSSDKGNIFYERKDFLVFFTLFACLATLHHIDVAGLCIMLNHIHIALAHITEKKLSAFIRDLKSMFAFEYNSRYSRKGALWQDDYGWSVKRGDKEVRTFASYLYNNPVEKHSCRNAEDYQWNFIGYAYGPNPFSQKVPLNRARNKYRKAVNLVKYFAAQSKPLTYDVLDILFDGLTLEEERALTDYIVYIYNCIDYRIFLSYYENLDNMLAAFKAAAGKEYDINEYKGPSSYREFKLLYRVCAEKGYIGKNRRFFTMEDEEKHKLYMMLKCVTGTSEFSIRHYIHYFKDD